MEQYHQFENQSDPSKWAEMSETQLEALETRQKQRIQALEGILATERDELASIIVARSASSQGLKFAVQTAPERYSNELSWKDKILFVVKQAGQPMHGKEIGPALKRLQPMGLKFSNLDNTISVHLTKLVRDGSLVRIKVKGRYGSLYGLVGSF